MFTRQRNEKGMALIVAIFVTIFLLFISSAFFVSGINSAKQSNRFWTKVIASETGSAGAERALWNIQKNLDANPDWVPSVNGDPVLLYGDYNNFVKNSGQDIYRYINYGNNSGISNSKKEDKEHYGFQLYATKLVKRDDPKATPEEWVICSAGISRLVIPGAKTVRNVNEVEILVRLGRTKPGNPEFLAMIDGAKVVGEPRNIYPNTYFHLEAKQNGISVPARIYTEADWINTNDGNTKLGNRNSSGRIGMAEESNFTFEEVPGVKNSMSPCSTWDNLVANKGIQIKNSPKMDFPEIDFDVFKNGKEQVKEADYKASDLAVPGGIWEDKGDYYQPKKNIMYMANKNSSVTSISGGDVYKDINGDGYTTIYIDKGFKFGSQSYGKIYVENDAHGIILSEGAFTSTGNKAYGNSQDAISGVGVDIQAEMHSVGGKNLDQGILPGGNQTLVDYKLGVKYPTMEDGGEYNVYGMYGATGGLLGCIWEDKNGNYVSGSPQGWGEPLWSDDVGILDIMSANNVIISNSYGNKNEGVSRFRGSIYSKKKLYLQADLSMRGAIAGKEGVIRVNQWANGLKNGSYGGYDFVELYENPLEREGGKTSIPESAVTGSGGSAVDKRQVVLLSWNTKG